MLEKTLDRDKYLAKLYEIVEAECTELDALYGDYIQHLIGIHGLNSMIANGLLESCGMVNSRQLYTLVKKGS